MSVHCVTWLALLVSANLPTLTLAQISSCPGIHVQILNIRNSTGTVDCALFDAPSFAAASFVYNGQNLEMTIRLQY